MSFKLSTHSQARYIYWSLVARDIRNHHAGMEEKGDVLNTRSFLPVLVIQRGGLDPIPNCPQEQILSLPCLAIPIMFTTCARVHVDLQAESLTRRRHNLKKSGLRL
jgi:hypothetical protein